VSFSLSRGNAKLLAALILEDMDSYAQERATEFAAFVAANSDTKTWTSNTKNLSESHINKYDTCNERIPTDEELLGDLDEVSIVTSL